MTREVGVYDDPRAPVLLRRDGEPFEGESKVEFVSAGAPVHFFLERKAPQRSSRIVAWFRAVDFDGEVLPRYYPVVCGCDRPVLNTECKHWRLKGGRSNLHGDAAVALGRLPKKGDKLTPTRLFSGKLFKAEIVIVSSDRNGKPLPGPKWHSRIGDLTQLEAGGSASASSYSASFSNSNADSSAFPVTKTSPIPTTKDGNEDPQY